MRGQLDEGLVCIIDMRLGYCREIAELQAENITSVRLESGSSLQHCGW